MPQWRSHQSTPCDQWQRHRSLSAECSQDTALLIGDTKPTAITENHLILRALDVQQFTVLPFLHSFCIIKAFLKLIFTYMTLPEILHSLVSYEEAVMIYLEMFNYHGIHDSHF